MKELQEITADYVIVDLGAGASYNIIDFWLMAPFGLLISAPEIPSILNAYSFLKTAAFRMLFRSFSRGGPERERIVDFVVNKMEGHGETFMEFAQKLSLEAGAKGERALAEITSLRPRVVINMGSGPEDAGISMRLREISSRNLGVNMDYIAYIMRDPEVSRSLGRRELLFSVNPESPFSRGIARAAERILAMPEGKAHALELDDEDLFGLMEKSLAADSQT